MDSSGAGIASIKFKTKQVNSLTVYDFAKLESLEYDGKRNTTIKISSKSNSQRSGSAFRYSASSAKTLEKKQKREPVAKEAQKIGKTLINSEEVQVFRSPRKQP